MPPQQQTKSTSTMNSPEGSCSGVLAQPGLTSDSVDLSNVDEKDARHEIATIFSIMQVRSEVATSFDNFRLSDLVFECLDIDLPEAQLLFSLAGEASAQTEQTPEAFNRVLREVLHRYRLQNLFSPGGIGEHHRGVTPTAYNEISGDIYAKEMARWRSDFRAMAPERQMMAATIIWLYQSGQDTTWLRRVPCTWRATEALNYLTDAGCLSDWLRLMATYPGW